MCIVTDNAYHVFIFVFVWIEETLWKCFASSVPTQSIREVIQLAMLKIVGQGRISGRMHPANPLLLLLLLLVPPPTPLACNRLFQVYFVFLWSGVIEQGTGRISAIARLKRGTQLVTLLSACTNDCPFWIIMRKRINVIKTFNARATRPRRATATCW